MLGKIPRRANAIHYATQSLLPLFGWMEMHKTMMMDTEKVPGSLTAFVGHILSIRMEKWGRKGGELDLSLLQLP